MKSSTRKKELEISGKHFNIYLCIALVSFHDFLFTLFSDKGKPLVISADLYVEAFGNIKEANMVSTDNNNNHDIIIKHSPKKIRPLIG